MRPTLYLLVLSIALISGATALADKPELQMHDGGICVNPVKMAVISPDLRLQSAWHTGGGIAQDCWGDLVYDCFEPVHVQTPWSPDGGPTDGAAWGGWDPVCDIGGQGTGGTSYRWFYGTTYCNPNVINDMTFDPPDSGRYGLATLAWWWYVNGVGTSEDLYLFIWCADDFNDCTAGPPGADHYYDGVVWLFTDLGHGGYYTSDLSTCTLGGAELPVDGDGAHQIVFGNRYDENYIYLASCAQTMLWGTKPGPDWNGMMNPSSQHDLQWDDDAPADGEHGEDECYSYFWEGYCPEVNGVMICFYEYIFDDPCGGPDATLCGDADCDNDVDGFDIDPFVLAMGDLAAWEAIYTCKPICSLDTNGDMRIDGFDIDGFVDVVGGGICPRHQ